MNAGDERQPVGQFDTREHEPAGQLDTREHQPAGQVAMRAWLWRGPGERIHLGRSDKALLES